MRTLGLGFVLAGTLAGIVWWLAGRQPSTRQPREEIRPAHVTSTTPSQAAVMAAVPLNVVVDLDLDLTEGSTVSITKLGREYGVGATTLDENKLALRRQVDPNAPSGSYDVNYRICTTDGTCGDGFFQFGIERQPPQGIPPEDLPEDTRGQPAVTIRLSQIAFQPQVVIISRGTEVTWINDDEVEHYVNTDSHPSHTYYSPQNSELLRKGDSFRHTFTQPGVYPYHCSAHASVMTATVIVD